MSPITTPLPPRVRDLVTALQVPVDGRYWLTRAGIGRPLGLVAPITGRLVWLHPVTFQAVRDAETRGLIRVGDTEPMPHYLNGGPDAWQDGQTGQPIALIAVGHHINPKGEPHA